MWFWVSGLSWRLRLEHHENWIQSINFKFWSRQLPTSLQDGFSQISWQHGIFPSVYGISVSFRYYQSGKSIKEFKNYKCSKSTERTNLTANTLAALNMPENVRHSLLWPKLRYSTTNCFLIIKLRIIQYLNPSKKLSFILESHAKNESPGKASLESRHLEKHLLFYPNDAI